MYAQFPAAMHPSYMNGADASGVLSIREDLILKMVTIVDQSHYIFAHADSDIIQEEFQ